jgi:hypothetical protein
MKHPIVGDAVYGGKPLTVADVVRKQNMAQVRVLSFVNLLLMFFVLKCFALFVNNFEGSQALHVFDAYLASLQMKLS